MTLPYALVLAAGLGSRFGGGKLLSPWRGGVLLDGALSVALDAPVRGVILVTGAQGEAVAAAARSLADRLGASERLTVVHAPAYAEGLSASLKAGLAALPDDAAGVIVFLGDMPVIPPAVLGPLVAAIDAGAQAAAPVHDGRRGHPVALPRALFAQIQGLTGDMGAGPLLGGLGEQLALIATDDPGVLLDVDRPGEAPP